MKIRKWLILVLLTITPVICFGASTDYKVKEDGTVYSYDLITKGPWVDVRAFGAVGNGTTDDTTAIRAAINSIATGIVFLPVGTYKITGVIAMKSGVILLGSGMGSAIIKKYGTGAAISLAGTPGSYIKKSGVRELKIEGNGSGTDGIYFKYAVDNTVERVWILSVRQHGIHLDQNAWNNNIVRNYIDGAGAKGIYIGQECNATNVSHNFIVNCDIGVGLFDEGTASCNGNRIEYNAIETSTTGHIYVYQQYAGVSTMQSTKIAGNSFEGTAPYVIKIDSSQSYPNAPSGNVIRDNYITSSTVGAKYLDLNTCDTTFIDGNTFYSGVDATAVHISIGATTIEPYIGRNKHGGSGTQIGGAGATTAQIGYFVRGTPSTGNVIKWNAGGYAEWAVP